MRIQPPNLRTVLSRPSTLAEAEAEAEVEEAKVVEEKIPTKASNRKRSLMTLIGAHVEEKTLEAGGAREDTETIKEMMLMQIRVVAGHVVN